MKMNASPGSAIPLRPAEARSASIAAVPLASLRDSFREDERDRGINGAS
jgi:hypothetical protein